MNWASQTVSTWPIYRVLIGCENFETDDKSARNKLVRESWVTSGLETGAKIKFVRQIVRHIY